MVGANKHWMLISTLKRNDLEITAHCSYFCAWMLELNRENETYSNGSIGIEKGINFNCFN